MTLARRPCVLTRDERHYQAPACAHPPIPNAPARHKARALIGGSSHNFPHRVVRDRGLVGVLGGSPVMEHPAGLAWPYPSEQGPRGHARHPTMIVAQVCGPRMLPSVHPSTRHGASNRVARARAVWVDRMARISLGRPSWQATQSKTDG